MYCLFVAIGKHSGLTFVQSFDTTGQVVIKKRSYKNAKNFVR